MSHKLARTELVHVKPGGRPEAPQELLAITVLIGGRPRREAFKSGIEPRELAEGLELAAAWLRALESEQ